VVVQGVLGGLDVGDRSGVSGLELPGRSGAVALAPGVQAHGQLAVALIAQVEDLAGGHAAHSWQPSCHRPPGPNSLLSVRVSEPGLDLPLGPATSHAAPHFGPQCFRVQPERGRPTECGGLAPPGAAQGTEVAAAVVRGRRVIGQAGIAR
jgi:hypothetical protein